MKPVEKELMVVEADAPMTSADAGLEPLDHPLITRGVRARVITASA